MAVTGTGEDSLRTAEADFIVAVWGGGGGFKRLRNRKCAEKFQRVLSSMWHRKQMLRIRVMLVRGSGSYHRGRNSEKKCTTNSNFFLFLLSAINN